MRWFLDQLFGLYLFHVWLPAIEWLATSWWAPFLPWTGFAAFAVWCLT